jgi:hypothetical protein
MPGMRDLDSKTAAISELAKQIKERERELKRLQDGLRLIPALQEQIKMLEGSVAMIQGKHGKEPKKAQVRLPLSNGAPSTTRTLVYQILKQAGKTLGPSEIIPLGLSHGKTIKYGTLTSMMAGRIKQEKEFYRDEAGKYGLREWEMKQA